MAAAFDRNTRELIREWADKAPDCGSLDKPRSFPDVEGRDVVLSRNTVYNGQWKFRYAFVQETGFPVVVGGPIPTGLDTPSQKVGKKTEQAKNFQAALEAAALIVKENLTPKKKATLTPSKGWDSWTWGPVEVPPLDEF